jgi:hypothetical protein
MARLTTKPQQIHQLLVSLDEIEPPIWRRLLVPSNTTLARLHDIIQAAFDWTGSHSHQFVVGEERYSRPEEGEEDPGIRDSRRVTVEGLLPEPGASLMYEYDFGDFWVHRVTLEQIAPAEPDLDYPICLDGGRASPPEDCGGAGGYEELVEALRQPSAAAERAAVRDWLGREFDPEAFDVKAVNESLRAIRHHR